eukprot:scaffold846_cov252-Pinguiococcus_pyrenoidosus.AAC.9
MPWRATGDDRDAKSPKRKKAPKAEAEFERDDEADDEPEVVDETDDADGDEEDYLEPITARDDDEEEEEEEEEEDDDDDDDDDDDFVPQRRGKRRSRRVKALQKKPKASPRRGPPRGTPVFRSAAHDVDDVEEVDDQPEIGKGDEQAEQAAETLREYLEGSGKASIIDSICAFMRKLPSRLATANRRRRSSKRYGAKEAANDILESIGDIDPDGITRSIQPLVNSAVSIMETRIAAEEAIWRAQKDAAFSSLTPLLQVVSAKADAGAEELLKKLHNDFLDRGRDLQRADRYQDAATLCLQYAERLTDLGAMVSTKGSYPEELQSSLAKKELLKFGNDINLVYASAQDIIGGMDTELVLWPALKEADPSTFGDSSAVVSDTVAHDLLLEAPPAVADEPAAVNGSGDGKAVESADAVDGVPRASSKHAEAGDPSTATGPKTEDEARGSTAPVGAESTMPTPSPVFSASAQVLPEPVPALPEPGPRVPKRAKHFKDTLLPDAGQPVGSSVVTADDSSETQT